MVEIRKIITAREVILSELGVAAPRPVVRALGMAVILNPFAGRSSMICARCSRQGQCSASG
jgi:hypothetical protein